MSAANTAAMPAAARVPTRAREAGAGSGSGDGKPDWRWQIGKAVFFYAAFQGVMGPNGLLAWYNGNLPSQKADLSTSSPQSNQVEQMSGSSATKQNPFSVSTAAVGPMSKFPSNTSTTALFGEKSAIDFYVFITTQDAPSFEDVTTQFSKLVSGAKGPRSVDAIDFEDDEYASLLQDPVRDAMGQPQVWTPTKQGKVLAAVKWSGLPLNDDSLSKSVDLAIQVPSEVQTANASLWAEIYATPAGHSPSNQKTTARMRKMLTRLYPQRKTREEKSLFGRGKNETLDDKPTKKNSAGALPFLDREVMPIITHWHPNLTLALVKQERGTGYPIASLPPPVLQWVHVAEDDKGEVIMKNGKDIAANYPIIFANDFWHLREHMHPLNDSTATLPLYINLYTASYFKFQLLSTMTDSFEKQPGMASGEIDMLKQTLLETSPWYLALTFAVSVLHSIFEFLAFSSDVSSWRNKKNMVGVSLGTILTNIFVQLIILLYLLDQSQDTSWMILFSQGTSIIIEAWKLTKAVDISLVNRKKGEGKKWLQWSPYRLNIRDRYVMSEEEKKTQEYDKLAFRIVLSFAAPLLGCYTIYSAVYQNHKGWWSFIIGTLCSFVYAFGFVSLIPQLIVNYKLKSTAGMNGKVFVYKILGTFVDDFFAFAIKMPLLHRLACFRDDLVFAVFLYQRWIYKVDNKRVNEYGQIIEPTAGEKREIEAETKKTQ